MIDIKELASRMNRSEFLNKYATPYYCRYILLNLKLKCNTDKSCEYCVKQAIKDIKFKDDLENETFEAECINDKWNMSEGKINGLTKGEIYPVKQSKYTDMYELTDDTGHIDTYFKTRFKPLENKVQEDTPIGIELRNINLTGLTLVDELEKAEEEEKEFIQALINYLYDKHEISRNHLLEELCDTIQVKLSTMKTIDIDIEEIVAYWNTKHLEKLKDRPRKERRCTELNDVNGYRIYEGNIVYQRSVLIGSPDIDFEGEVKFYDGSWWIDDGKSAIYLFNESCENRITRED